ncbi:MAG: tRNA lysidine(34) synthetase TilS [Lachnospiraceae bacterium]|nr:tRNA lysidine(34) synthetase TilS [Lachnospiraceae bacterium]
MIKEKVKKYIEEERMADGSEHILAAVSGGPDSVCMLMILKELGYETEVLHVHHGLREAADEDEEFVRALGEKLDVPFLCRRVDVKSYAEKEHLSTEEAGRRLRYAFFEERAEELEKTGKKVLIAVAHNMDDNAETVLFQLFRGSGPKGLCGIPPLRDRVIRPMLCCRRSEIEEYLASRDQGYRIDESNETNDYTRNRIRHIILPAANEQINARSTEHVAGSAAMLREAEDFIEDALGEAYVENVRFEDGIAHIGREGFKKLHPYIRKRLLLAVMKEVCGSARDITAVHLRLFDELFSMETGKVLDMPHRMLARCERIEILLLNK